MCDKISERTKITRSMALTLQIAMSKAMFASNLCVDDAELCKKWYAEVIGMGERIDALITEWRKGTSDDQ
ncbi:MAG: hypothetical protein WCY84_00240 [Candidatus Cloacimonadaceae bacterium]